NYADLEEYVFRKFTHLYERLEEGKRLIDPSRFHEMRYEDLVRDPIGAMRELYAHLGLRDFDAVRPQVERYFADKADYKTNRYEQMPDLRARIEARWGNVIRRYGYG